MEHLTLREVLIFAAAYAVVILLAVWLLTIGVDWTIGAFGWNQQ